MKRIAVLIASIALGSLVIAGSAFAQQAPAKKGPSAQMGGPCGEDAAKLCKDVQRGGGRIIACLQGQPDKLSPACKAELTRFEERRAQMKDRKMERKAGPMEGHKKGPMMPQPATPPAAPPTESGAAKK